MRADRAQLCDGTALCTPEAVAALRIHAVEAYPAECLGYIDGRGAYQRLVNVAAEPKLSALANRRVLAALIRTGDLRALCHSHPGGPDCPSEQDMRSQIEMCVPFVIVSTNGQATEIPFAWGDELRDDEPYVGRSFRHAVTDCYALIRLWYLREAGVDLPDYPRSWEWWKAETPGDKDLYRRYFADAGFVEIDARSVRHGDVWLAAIRSDVPNHAGVYLDGGLALHHPSSGLPSDPGHLSKRDSIARWTPWITHWVRRTDGVARDSSSRTAR
jgi:proteasome lid subunit RPN8/RPN11